MMDQSKVTSGFDVEFLMTEEYIRYFLLTSLETGAIPWFSIDEQKDNFGNVIQKTAFIIHPPDIMNDKRLYDVNTEFAGNEHPFQDLVSQVYSQREDEFQITILENSPLGGDIRVRLFPSVIQDLHTSQPKVLISNLLPLDLEVTFSVVFRELTNGLVDNIGLELKLLDISGPLIDVADNDANFSKENTLAELKEQIDRTLDFGLSGGGSLQKIQYQKFVDVDGAPNAIGVYINLALQNGPESDALLPDRGDITLAQNFLPESAKMAFAFGASTYSRLADDFKFKMAELKPGTTDEYHFPIKDDDTIVGKIKGVKVYPELNASDPGNPFFTNVLVIDVHGEYFIDNFFDPDFHFQIRLTRTVRNGIFDFDIDYDLDLSLGAHLVAFFLGTVVTFLAPKLGIGLIFAGLLIVKIIEEIGEDIAAEAVKPELDRTGFMDTLPHKLLVEPRRWDPLFFSQHRIEADDVELLVNQHGLAFASKDLFLGRKDKAIDHMVIRSETRDADNAVDGLLYRAKDIQPYLETDLVNSFPATFRLPYREILNPESDIEFYRVSLTLDQVEERLALKEIHLAKIEYKPRKVDIIEHQIYQILTISNKEVPEIESLTRRILRSEIQQTQGAAISQQAQEELEAELGRPPTNEELEARVESILSGAINNAFPVRLHTELNRRMKFDLEPPEFATLQHKNILILGKDHLVIRKMKRDGKIIIYYRDYERPFEPGTSKEDNLMSLPRYKSTSLNS